MDSQDVRMKLKDEATRLLFPTKDRALRKRNGERSRAGKFKSRGRTFHNVHGVLARGSLVGPQTPPPHGEKGLAHF